MFESFVNRFAFAGPDGTLVALVADGVPEWPADIAAVEDAQLAELEAAFLAEFDRLAADESSTDESLAEISTHVRELRDEAARRYAAAADTVTDPAEPVTDPAEPVTADGGTDEDEPDRAARIEALRRSMAPEPDPIVLPDPGVSREDLVAAVAAASTSTAQAAAQAAVQGVVTALQALAVPDVSAAGPASRIRLRAADLGEYRPEHLAPTAEQTSRPRFNARLVATGDIANVPMGSEFSSMDQLAEAFSTRLRDLGTATGAEGEKVPIATLRMDVPPERDIRGLEWAQARQKVAELIAASPLRADESTIAAKIIPVTASGGLDQPVEPYYPQMVVADAGQPVRDSLPSFAAERGGIKLLLPPSIGSISAVATPGQFADGVTNSDTSLVSATAAFTASDVGSPVVGAGIAAGTIIASVTNGTTVVLSHVTTATATGVTFRILNRNPYNLGAPVGLVSAAQDAAGPPNTVKFTYDVPNGSQVEFDVYSVYTSLQFANLTARTAPERMAAYIRVADALHARVAETQRLDVMTAWSTLFTGAKTFGTARQFLGQLDHMGAFYRNSERMADDAPLNVLIPAWSIQNMRQDYLNTFIGGGAANWGLSDDEIVGFFTDAKLVPTLYRDGPSDVSQLFATSGLAGATNTGANSATPIAIPDYPGSGSGASFRTKIVSFLYAEGSWLDLNTGELNIGLVRDSVLNAQNRFRDFFEEWATPAFVGTRSLRCVHTVAADGTYGAAASVTLGAGNGL